MNMNICVHMCASMGQAWGYISLYVKAQLFLTTLNNEVDLITFWL